jgi:hypothetical protein
MRPLLRGSLLLVAGVVFVSPLLAEIEAIQVNQAIGVQKNNARKFVAGKDTVVRAILSAPAEIDPAQTRATIKRDGETVVTLEPSQSSSAVRIVDFVCPSRTACGHWAAGSYTFEVTVNGQTTSTAGTTYDFVERGSIRILAVPVTANYGGTIVEVTDSRWKTFGDYVRGTYPVAADKLLWSVREDFDASDPSFDLETEDGRRNLWEALEKLIPATCAGTPEEDGCFNQVFGFIMARPMGYPNGRLQGYTYGKPANIGVITDDDAAATVAHEIGHTYGLGDTYDGGSFACAVNPAPAEFTGKDFDDPSKTVMCSGREALEGVSGTKIPAEHHPYEVGGRGALPPSAEYMGSGGSQEQFWTTQDAWDWLFDKLVPPEPQDMLRVAATPQRFIQCFGAIRRNAATADDVQMDPCWEFEDTDLLPNTTGPYMMAAVNAAGVRIATDALDPEFDPVGPKGLPSQPVEFAPFTSEFAFPAETVKLQVIRNDVVLREFPVTANAPAVSNVAPQLSGVVNGPVTVTWDASDADGGALSFTVLYNSDIDNPESEWWVLARDVTERRFDVDFSEMPGGPRAQIAIVATDGIRAGEGESAPFVVAAKPPEVFVEDTGSGVYLPGELVILDGDAFDLQDDDIAEDQMRWTSNISGALGIGTPLAVDDLPVGRHTITLSVTNSAGLTGSDSVTVSIVKSFRRRAVRR